MVSTGSGSAQRSASTSLARAFFLAFLAALAVLALAAAPAFAGQASSGQLFFYPCTNCHPVVMVPGPNGTEHPSKPLPNNFTGHSIRLIGHDALGVGDDACMTCHDDPARNPGMLKLADGTLIPITSPKLALVCYRCHSDRYKQWKAGTHGKHYASCVVAGCHDPHTPGFIFAQKQMPFVGTGWQFQIAPQRVEFKALAPPAPNPAVVIPSWFVGLAVIGIVVAGGFVGVLVSGRFKR